MRVGFVGKRSVNPQVNDTYVIRGGAGNDRIFGVEQGNDIIEYRNGVTFASLSIVQSGSNVVITSANGVTTIIGATVTDFTASDFTFL